MRPLSPIERMVDAACGYVPGKPTVSKTILLRCPKCKRTKRVAKDKLEPKTAVELVLECPDCFREGTFEDPRYLDKNRKDITHEFASKTQ